MKAQLTVIDQTLVLSDAHFDGLNRGLLGLVGLNALAYAIMEERGANRLIIEGGTRSTGLRRGKRSPYTLQFIAAELARNAAL